MNGRYLLVKFVPDEVRFEPINIGVIVETSHGLVTKMADEIDPRIRYADPYADVGSLREFLSSFDARAALRDAGVEPSADQLGRVNLPNIYLSAPREIDVAPDAVGDLVAALFRRLVERNFDRPPEMQRAAGWTAAKTAMRGAFIHAGVLKRKVQSDVPIRGASGHRWMVDFRYVLPDGERLVEAATTNVREDLRRREHGFEAFVILVDATSPTGRPPRTGVLAVDSRPEENDVSAELKQLAKAHNLEFVAGQHGFYELAARVRREALGFSDEPTTKEQQSLF